MQLITEDATEAIASHFSIDCIPNAGKEQSEFLNLLLEESLLHKVNAVGKSLEDLRIELKENVLIEKNCFIKRTIRSFDSN